MNDTDAHIFSRFDNELAHLHALVMRMGRVAVAQLRDAQATLAQHDSDRARAVIDNDKTLNDLDVQADDEIVRIIALRQPMATDLRKIIAVSKIVAELERAGDEARKIAGLTIRFYADGDCAPDDAILGDLHALAEYVAMMLVAVMQAFDQLNLDEALAVLQKERQLDDRVQASFRHLRNLDTETAADNAEPYIATVLAIRALERFGNHAKNIAGHLVFIKHGVDVRHEDIDGILQRINEDG